MAYAKKKKKSSNGNKSNASVPLPNTNVTVDDEHERLIQWVNECDEGTVFQTHEIAARCRDYYDSNQWTSAEISKLKAQKQAATVINRIKPKMDGLMGMESANRTTAKAQPRTPKHAAGATAATEATRFVLQDNFYGEVRSAAWENLLLEGTGGVEVIAEDMGEGQDIRITINQIMWDRIIYDPHSRKKDFSDARFLGQVVWMDYDEAVALYPEAADVLEIMQNDNNTYGDKPRWIDGNRRRVKIVELYYYKPNGEVWYACFTRGGWCKRPKISPYVNEENETEWPYEFASLFVTTEGVRYGAAFQYLDVQDEINKRRSKALHLMSVRQTFGTAGAVADVNKARAEMAKPDGHVEFAFGELNKDFGVLPTGDMAAAQFNLLTEAKTEIDSVGYNAAASGKDQRAISGVALRQRTQASQTELAPMFNVLKHMDIRVYRKVWNRIKQYWKSEKWIRVTDDENNLKFVGLNKPQTRGEQMLSEAQQQGIPPEQMQILQQRIMQDPEMQKPGNPENDIANLDVDIVMDEAPDTVTQEVEDFQAMAEMVKSGFPLPPEAVIMASPLSNKDRILKMMKEQPQLPPQVKEQMEKMQEEMQKLGQENQSLKQDQQAEQAKLQMETQKAQAELALQKQKQEGEAQLARAKAEAEFELKKYIAEQELALETLRCENEQRVAKQKMDFDLKVKQDEESEKLQQRAREEEAPLLENAMPKFVEALAQITQTFASALEGQQKALSEVAQAINNPAPKTIVAKSSTGMTMSATVN